MGKLFCTQKISIWSVLLIIFLFVAITVGLCVYAKKTEKHNMKFRARRNLSKLIRYSSIGFLVACAVGVFLIDMPILNILLMPTYSEDAIYTGIVSRYVVSEDTYKKFVLTDCKVVNGSIQDELEYDILIYTDNYAVIELGDRITFDGDIIAYDMSDEYGMHSLINNIGYSAYISFSNMTIGEGKVSLRDWIHNKVYTLLQDNLNKENADISYAILFGDKNGLDDGISDMFGYAGISHILAVSGLHVSVLVTILWFLLDKIKCNKYVKLALFGGMLLFYAYLCYFSPSVCRACIMAMTLASCKAFRLEYDSLSSLSLAGIVILLITPQMLFSISFQLSFMCIFSIISLSPGLNIIFDKIKCPKWLASSLSMSIAVNIAVLPISINSFGEVSLLGIISNIFILPIFSVVYVLLFTLVVIGVIISPLGILLTVPEMFLHIIKVIATYVSKIPFGVFRIFNISYWSVALIVFTSLIIHFLMTKHYLKTVVVLGLVVMIGVVFGINMIPKEYSNDILVPTQYKSGVTILSDENTTALIGSDVTEKKLILMLKKLRIKNIDEIYAFDLQLNELDELENICDKFNVKKIYIPEKYNYDAILTRFDNCQILQVGSRICGYTFEMVEKQGNIIAVKLINDDKVVLIPNRDNTKAENTEIITYYLEGTDYILVEDDNVWSNIQDYSGILHFFEEKELIIEG